MQLTNDLRNKYINLFKTIEINPVKEVEIENAVNKMLNNKSYYEMTRIPWYYIGCIHILEGNGNLKNSLYNGQPWNQKSTIVPVGVGPFNSWEDHLNFTVNTYMKNFTDFSFSSVLYNLESHNGFGYAMYHPEINTPYLWSYSNHYVSGKYGSDGKYDPTLVSRQPGCAVLIKKLVDMGELSFPELIDNNIQIDPQPQDTNNNIDNVINQISNQLPNSNLKNITSNPLVQAIINIFRK